MKLPETCPFCGAGVFVLEDGTDGRDGSYVKFECHTWVHLHVKEPCNQSPTCKDAERTRLAARVAELEARCKRLEEAVSAYQAAYEPDGHVRPLDCFAMGPKTGDPIQDLVACPGCFAARKAKEAKP